MLSDQTQTTIKQIRDWAAGKGIALPTAPPIVVDTRSGLSIQAIRAAVNEMSLEIEYLEKARRADQAGKPARLKCSRYRDRTGRSRGRHGGYRGLPEAVGKEEAMTPSHERLKQRLERFQIEKNAVISMVYMSHATTDEAVVIERTLCGLTNALVDELSAALAAVPEPPSGWHNGQLYCYGGCGTLYKDFPPDMSLPTPLWNRIAVGAPFDETDSAEQEGRGGVLCPTCIVKRLAALPDCTVIFANIDVGSPEAVNVALLKALKDVAAYFEKQLKYYESANEPGFRTQHRLWSMVLAAIALAESAPVSPVDPSECRACKGKGVGAFTPPGELTYSGKCQHCDGSGKVLPAPPLSPEAPKGPTV